MITRLRMTVVALAGALAAACSDPSQDPTGLAPSFHRGDGGGREAPQFSEWSAPVNLGPPVNTAFADVDPFVSRNGLSLYIVCLDCPGGFGGFDIWVAQRASADQPWGPPRNLGPAINTEFSETNPVLTPDGHRLLFTSNRPGSLGAADLYVASRHNRRDDLAWRDPVNLGAAVNTTADDRMPATPFEDERTGATVLYFASNRPGGSGDNDIYATTLLPDGGVGPAELVSELSTSFSDQHPEVRRDGLELFLVSNRTGTLGALDIWVATRASTADPWSTPVNLGAVVNSAFPEASPALSFDGTTLYLQAASRPGNVGGPFFDLWAATRTRLHRTVLVNPNGTGDRTAKTIQEGIAMVAPGGRVRVVPGTYNEALVINKGLTLEAARGHDDDHGESGAAIIAPALGPEAAIEIGTTDHVVIRRLTVRYDGFTGIRGNGPVDLTVERATISGPSRGGVVVINDAPAGRARLTVRDSRIDGPTTDPRVNQQGGISGFGDVDALIDRNVVRGSGGACIIVLTRLDLGGETNAQILDNDVDACGEAGGIRVGRRGPAPTGPPATATGIVNVSGNVIRNIPGSCVSRTGINWEALGGTIERNSVVGYVQACAGPGPRALPGAIWVGSIVTVHPQATPVVRFNDIEGNAQAGLRLGPNMTTPIDARCNYWGSASGPTAAGGFGTGDAIVVETGAAAPGFAPSATAPIASSRHHDDDDDDHRDECGRSEWSEPVHLGSVVNATGFDGNGSLSADGLRLYFQSDRAGGFGANDLWVARRASIEHPWEAPVNLGPVINSTGADAAASLSNDGRLLFYTSTRPGGLGGADLYVARREDPSNDLGWDPPLNLGPHVNTPTDEQGVEYWESPDGRSAALYFNRGVQAMSLADLYAAPITRNGEPLGPAQLLAELSTPGANDAGASVRADGREILFWSSRAGSFGPSDLWVSTRRRINDVWSTPVNLGAPLNTQFNENRPNLSHDGRTVIFDSSRPGGVGGTDLWMSTRRRGGR